MATPYASKQELEAYADRTLDGTRADLALELASAAVDDAAAIIGATIDKQTGDTVTLDGDGTATLLLPWPVIDVTKVVEIDDDGTEEELTGPGNDDIDYRWTRLGELLRVGSTCWPARARSVEVTLDHGLDPVPATIKAVVLEVAETMLTNPSQLDSLNTDDTSASFNAGGITLSRSQERRVLRAIR
ncbi:MAG: hypothetical protein ACLFWR_13295 [Acidimicrobiales bacterium]